MSTTAHPRAYVIADIDGARRRFPVVATQFRDDCMCLRVLAEGPLTLPLTTDMTLYGEDDRPVTRGRWVVGSDARQVGPRDQMSTELRIILPLACAG